MPWPRGSRLAGSSTLALDLFAYSLGLLVFWTGWLVLRRFLDRPAALFGLAVLAAPPLFLVQWSFKATPNYNPLMILGHVCLLATHTIFVADPGRPRALLGLGLLAGLGWWTNPLIAAYLAPFGILALRTGLARRPRVGWFVAGLCLGGLPGWIYELWHFPSARFALHQGGFGNDFQPLGQKLAMIGGKHLPLIMGLDPKAGRTWIAAFFVVTVPFWTFALVRAAVRDRAELTWLAGGRGRIGRGLVVFWIVAGTLMALMLATRRPLHDYYLLPLYAVFPAWMGEGLDWLRRRRPAAAVGSIAALAALLAVHAWANWRATIGSTPPEARAWAPLQRRNDALVEWLRSRGIDRVYTADPLNFSPDAETYVAGGRVLFVDLWRDHGQTYSRRVDAAVSPPVIALDPAASRLRTGFQALDMEVTETQVGELRVLEPRARFTTTFVSLPRDGWTIAASHRTEQARDLLDGDAATSWDTGGAQAPGQWLAVDLGSPQVLTRIDLLAVDWQNVSAGLRVELSLDAEQWQTVASVPDYWGPLFFSEHHTFLRVRRGRVQAIFPPVRARHVRIAQTAAGTRSWAARELFVYGPGGPRPPVPRPGELTAALRREGVRFVYANHWLSARVRDESRDRIGALDSNLNVNDSSRTEPDPTELLPPRLAPGYGFLLGADADAAGVRAMLAGQAVAARESQAGPYRLLALAAPAAPVRLDKRGWRVVASDGSAHAVSIIDEDRRTRWVSGPPAARGSAPAVTLDVGYPRALRGVEVRPGLPGRDLRLAASLDGATWTEITPLAWAGALYWTGTELLRNGGPRWAATFPPTRLRYLRLSPAAALPEPWTIAEVEALE